MHAHNYFYNKCRALQSVKIRDLSNWGNQRRYSGGGEEAKKT